MKASSVLCMSFLVLSFTTSANATGEKDYRKYDTTNDTIPTKNDTTYTDENGETKVFAKVEKEAEFPGGLDGWREFVVNNLNPNTPADKGAPVGQYTVIVQFIVGKSGAVSDVKAKTNFGYGMEAEVLRMIKKSPKWIPARLEGQFVNAYRQQPVTFVVQEEKKKRRSRD